jgi:hypothetical protein
VSISEIQLGLGPESLTYSEMLAGKLVHYIPEGITLPKRCPRGGFPFAVTLGVCRRQPGERYAAGSLPGDGGAATAVATAIGRLTPLFFSNLSSPRPPTTIAAVGPSPTNFG